MVEQTNVVGEPQTFYVDDDASLAIRRMAKADTEGILRVDQGRAGQFELDYSIASLLLTKDSYDFMHGEGSLPRNTLALFGVTVVSDRSISMTVIDSATKLQVLNRDGRLPLVSPIRVKIYTDAAFKDSLGVSCAYYVKAAAGLNGSLSFEGCTAIERENTVENYVVCECNHLSEFVAAIDSSIAACGDGVIQQREECDDGNIEFQDGCSPSCEIEDGASCWNVGEPPAVSSRCCAPCAAGSYRTGCVIQGDPYDAGRCQLCPENTFKPDRGSWDSMCQDCPPGEQSGRGAEYCASDPPCDAGFFRPAEGEACRPCAAGTYKPDSGSALDQCDPHKTCQPGFFLDGYSTTNPGTCEPCPPSTYKDVTGDWETRCTPCPAGSSSDTTGNNDRDSCRCGEGYVNTNQPPPAFCDDINECLDENVCEVNAECVNTEGSFVCSGECGDGVTDGYTTSNEACDDGNVAIGDGCSTTCTIEANFDCDNSQSPSECSCVDNQYTQAGGQECALFCFRPDTCNGHGNCAPDPPAGVGEGGGWCSCDPTWFGQACTVQLTPLWTVEYGITDPTIAHTIFNDEFELALHQYALSTTETIRADGFSAADMPPLMQPTAGQSQRRQLGGEILRTTEPDRWSFAGNVVTLNPDGTKCNGNEQNTTNLTLRSDVTELRSNEKLAIYTWDVERAAWKSVPGAKSSNFSVVSNTVKAPLYHFSAYVVVREEYGDPVAVPPPPSSTPAPTEDGLSTGAIVALVLVPLLLLGAGIAYYMWLQDQKKAGKLQSQASAEAEVGFDVPEPTPAPPLPAAPEPPVESPGEPTPQQPLPSLEEAQVRVRLYQALVLVLAFLYSFPLLAPIFPIVTFVSGLTPKALSCNDR